MLSNKTLERLGNICSSKNRWKFEKQKYTFPAHAQLNQKK